MPERFQQETYDIAYQALAERDGEYCLDPECRRGPPHVKLQIDHADNNPRNRDLSNLHLFCQRHNLAMRQLRTADKIKLIKYYSAVRERERVRARGNPSTGIVRKKVDYNQGSPEMQANSRFEIQYRDWILTEIRTNTFITKEEAVYSGAEITGASPTTTERYLKKLTSSAGPLRISKDTSGTQVIEFREGLKPPRMPSILRRHEEPNQRDGDTVPISRPLKNGGEKR